MNTIMKIINVLGGLEALKKQESFKIKNEPYMDLNIDYICLGPNGRPMISVAHNFIQNGDLMADPDMEIEILDGEMFPLTFQMDSLGLFQNVYEIDGKGGISGVNHKLKKELGKFLNQWGKNLERQGFLGRAEIMSQEARALHIYDMAFRLNGITPI